MFNATFNNISVISWRSVLLVEETGANHRPAEGHWKNFITKCCIGIRTHNASGDKSNYNTITTTSVPVQQRPRQPYIKKIVFKKNVTSKDISAMTKIEHHCEHTKCRKHFHDFIISIKHLHDFIISLKHLHDFIISLRGAHKISFYSPLDISFSVWKNNSVANALLRCPMCANSQQR